MSSHFGNILGSKPAEPAGPWPELAAKADPFYHQPARNGPLVNGHGPPFPTHAPGPWHTSPTSCASALGLSPTAPGGVRLPTAPSFWPESHSRPPLPSPNGQPPPQRSPGSAFSTYHAQQQQQISSHLISPRALNGPPAGSWAPMPKSTPPSTVAVVCRPSPQHQASPTSSGQPPAAPGLPTPRDVYDNLVADANAFVSHHTNGNPPTLVNGAAGPPRTNGLLMVPPTAPVSSVSSTGANSSHSAAGSHSSAAGQRPPSQGNGVVVEPTTVAQPKYTSCLELGLMEAEVSRQYANATDESPRPSSDVVSESPNKKGVNSAENQPSSLSVVSNSSVLDTSLSSETRDFQAVTPPASRASKAAAPETPHGQDRNETEKDDSEERPLAIAEECATVPASPARSLRVTPSPSGHPPATSTPAPLMEPSPIRAAAAALFRTPEAETMARRATMEYTKALMLSIEDQNMEAARRLEAKIVNETRVGVDDRSAKRVMSTPPSPATGHRVDSAHMQPQEHLSALARGLNPAVASLISRSSNSGHLFSQEFPVNGSSSLRPRAPPFADMGGPGAALRTLTNASAAHSPLSALTATGFQATPSIATFTASAIGSVSSADDVLLSQKLTSCSPSGNLHTCNICGFQATTKFHINSHMNTHFDHKCRYCDYTSRTEGRLKAHMKNFHTYPMVDASADAAPPAAPPSNGPSTAGEESNDGAPEPAQLDTSFDDSLTTHSLCDMQSGVSQLLPGMSPMPGEGDSPEEMMESEDEPGVFVSQSGGISVSGKPKTYKCKQCQFVAQSKNEYWTHARTHIKKDKQLKCTKCLFVTEYKHHLEYHLRNHYGSKPFRCTKCNYSCVNKSMLNSHMKSHSNFYPYRCANCTYATKYCHSLKLHLRKYNHTPATVVNPDGTTTDAMAIDIYGNRRGPRQRKISDSIQAPGLLLPNGPPISAASDLSGLFGPSFMEAALGGGAAHLLSNNMPALGATLPTISSLAAVAAVTSASGGDHLPSNILPTLRQHGGGGAPPHSTYRCSLCEFTSARREELTLHLATHHFSPGRHSGGPAVTSAAEILSRSLEARRDGGSEPTTQQPPSVSLGREEKSHVTFSCSEESHQKVAVSTTAGLPSHDGQTGGSSRENSPHGTSAPGSGTPESGPPKSPASGSGSGGKSGDESGDGARGGPHSLLGSGARRRKGQACKLDRIALKLKQQHNHSPPVEGEERGTPGEDGAEECPTLNPESGAPRAAAEAFAQFYESASGAVQTFEGEGSNGAVVVAGGPEAGGILHPTNVDWSEAYVCGHCEMAFRDIIMYSLHMGYHVSGDPYRCNRCGKACSNRVEMFVHIAQEPHY